ncbi:MAG TPA: hypothetical protein VNA25_01125 [Phycisphaerae bacterium]|nr:hypothetical protein [Phycisphaerae bacterium]
MPTLQNDAIGLHVNDDGTGLVLADRRRRCRWRLGAAHRGCRLEGARDEFLPLAAGSAVRQGRSIVATHPLSQGTARFTWTLAEDHVRVTLQSDAEDVEFIALPGAFFPDGSPHEVAIPVYQGLILRGGGDNWEEFRSHAGHMNFSMAMGAVIQPAGGLLVTHECPANWFAAFGQCEAGPFFRFEQRRCGVDGWAGAEVRLYPTDADLTAVCKRYRARVIERGEFVPWAQKVQAKPIVKELFGALMAFVGYNHSPQTDYVASAKRLRSRGFESVFYYPLRMCHYSLGFKMGGDDPIWLDDATIEALRAVPGAHLAPWGWTVEGLDDGSRAMRDIFILGPRGRPVPNWKIDEFQWYLVCTPYQVEHIRRRFATDMKAMDWIHYDVNAMWAGLNCFNAEHALHDHRPLGRIEDVGWTRRLFSPETVGNRVVSSEGFGDHYAGWYDIGTTKVMPAPGERPASVPVPMTMLVFHDSCIHDWWEVHNYNAHAGFPIAELPHAIGRTGSGEPRLKAAIDALYGCPPNLFPFGRQYSWSDFATRQSYSYQVRLEDDPVQEAIAAALPVTRLHRRIGMCEMLSFELLSDDGLVQATTFSDGTRVVANLWEQTREIDGHGPVPAHSWREARM